jgi:hypothetical protein
MNRAFALLSGLLMASMIFTTAQARDADDPDAPKWAEVELQLPAFPQEANLREFYVSELTTHKFYIDASSLTIGTDGVVRYVLVVRTSGGATNISYEGIRCESRELKIYASGRQDSQGGKGGQWSKTRRSEWRLIENKPVNRYHAALARDLFCPNGTPIRTPAEGQEALRLGRHPEVSRNERN